MTRHRRVSHLSLALGMALAGPAFLLLGMSYAQGPAQTAAPAAVSAASTEGGIATIEPSRPTAGVTDTFCLVYTATQPIAETGGIRIVDPDFHGTRWTMWQELQKTNPAESGYLTVTTKGDAELFIDRSGSSNPQYESDTVIRVTSGAVAVGDEVALCFVEGRIPHKAYKGIEWETSTDAGGDGTFSAIAIPP